MIDYGSGQVFISAVISPIQFRVQTATGGLPADVPPAPVVSVNTITRAFNSISSAVTGSVNASHLNASNLVSLEKGLTWVCYDDGPLDVSSTTTINGYTTSAQHFITLTAAGASQVATGNSQRHAGVAGAGTRMERSGAGPATLLDVDEPYSRVEWLELDGNDVGTTAGIRLTGAADQSLVRNVLVHHLDGVPGDETSTSSGIFIEPGNDSSEVRNSIVYAYDGDGVHVSGTNAIVANSTFYLGRTTPSSNSVQTDTGATVTADVYNVLAVGPETDFWENTAGGLSLYNCISTDSSACDYDVSGSCLTGITENTEFVSLAGPVNLHLRAGARAIDFGTSLASSFNEDVDGHPRPQGAAWDVGADESFFSGATTYYRSIGTRADYGTTQTDGNGSSVTATQGSSSITCAGTCLWRTFNRGRGDVIEIDGVPYVVAAVSSEAQLTLASLYTGTTGGGKAYRIRRQYATLQDWESCIDGGPCSYFGAGLTPSLVADDRAEVGIAYEETPLARVTISGSTTDATHTITLTADGANRHYGIVGGGVVVNGGGLAAILVEDDFVTLEWLEVTGGTEEGLEFQNLSASNKIVVRNMLIHDVQLQAILVDDAEAIADIYNNFVYNTAINTGSADGAISFGLALTPGEARVFNNTLYDNPGDGIVAAGSNPSITLINNISHSNGGVDYDVAGRNASSSNNLASDTSGTTHSPAGGGQNSVPLSGAGGVNFEDDETVITPQMNLHLQSSSFAIDRGKDNSALFSSDIDAGLRPQGAAWDLGADEFGATTAVELMSFEAVGLDSAVDLSWRTGSELNNLGFHLHRSLREDGPWTRITLSLIPGLGSSPEGASYSFRDTGLTNGVRYFYRLEDIDSDSGSTFHGPVSAVPGTAPPDEDDDGSGSEDPASEEPPEETRTYGRPENASFRVVSRTKHAVVVELSTPGFVATETPSGVRVSVPGFDQRTDPRAPDLPLKRVVLDALVGRHARIVWVKERKTRSFPGLTPAAVGSPEILTSPDGTVRPRRRSAALKGEGLLPPVAAAIAGDAFIGETKKLALEMNPIRYDASTDTLLLARTLRVRIAFDRKAARDESGRGSRGRRRPRFVEDAAPQVLAHLHTQTRGLHAVSFETLFPQGHEALPLESLRLSRQGESVPFHVEPKTTGFGPGSVLYFHASQEAASTDYSSEVAYALERAPGGVPMPLVSVSPRGSKSLVSASLAEASFETNRYYQAGLLDAPDIWLWDFMVAGMSKSFPLAVEGLDPTSALSAHLQVFFQGASEAETEGEHHLSVSLNGTPLGETSFDGKLPHVFSTSVPASCLQEGENTLTVTNLGDTGVYSFVFLDRVDLVYSQTPALRSGLFSGVFSEAGEAVLSGEAQVGLDVTGPEAPVWLSALRPRSGTVSFETEAGHRYVLASAEGLLMPRVSLPLRSTLRRSTNQAEYVVIAPEAFLEAARPLLERRQDQGLTAKGVSFEEIASEFGRGRPSAQAIRDFLAYAYHSWTGPSLRYVLLLGDSSYDPRNLTGFDQGAPLPAMWAKTSYLWTSSDPTFAAVNGEDLLPDVAIGRLPAKTLAEAQALVQKVLAWEDSAQDLSGTAVLVADNPDLAGDFEADVLDIRTSFLGGRPTKTLFLRQLGRNTRPEILASFDEGASLMSYVGHGGAAVWASENVLNSWDTGGLRAQSSQPLMLTFNCLNGYFLAPNYDSLSEAFLKVEGRGTIGAFSPSGLSLDGPAHQFHRALMAEMTSGAHDRLGDAVLAAQAAYAEAGLMPELLAIYHLFGDPAMRIRSW